MHIGKHCTLERFWLHRHGGELPGIRSGLSKLFGTRWLRQDSIEIFEFTWDNSDDYRHTLWYYAHGDSLIFLDDFGYEVEAEFAGL